MALFPYMYSDLYRPARLLDQHFGLAFSPEDVMLPLSCPYFRPWRTSTDAASTITDDKDKFQLCLDVQHFKPDEITVKATNKQIIIEAKHEEKADEHGLVSRQFTRKYSLPDGCDCNDVSSSLTADGVLVIKVTKLKRVTGEQERLIPINTVGALCQKTKKYTVENIKDPIQMKSKDCTMKKDDLAETKFENLKEESSKIDSKCSDLKEEYMKMDSKFNLKEECALDSKMLNKDVSAKRESMFDSKSLTSRDERCRLLNSDGLLKISGESVCVGEAAVKSSARSERMEMSSTSSSVVTQSESTLTQETSSFTSSGKACGLRLSSESASDFISDMIATELKLAADNL